MASWAAPHVSRRTENSRTGGTGRGQVAIRSVVILASLWLNFLSAAHWLAATAVQRIQLGHCAVLRCLTKTVTLGQSSPPTPIDIQKPCVRGTRRRHIVFTLYGRAASPVLSVPGSPASAVSKRPASLGQPFIFAQTTGYNNFSCYFSAPGGFSRNSDGFVRTER